MSALYNALNVFLETPPFISEKIATLIAQAKEEKSTAIVAGLAIYVEICDNIVKALEYFEDRLTSRMETPFELPDTLYLHAYFQQSSAPLCHFSSDKNNVLFGYCYGFTKYWLIALLEKKDPKNIPDIQAPLANEEDINTHQWDHWYQSGNFMRLTAAIHDYQKLQFNLTDGSEYVFIHVMKIYSSPERFAKELAISSLYQTKRGVGYRISLQGDGVEGHALGFYRSETGTEVDFFDANWGWFKVPKQAFRAWLVEYINNYLKIRSYTSWMIEACVPSVSAPVVIDESRWIADEASDTCQRCDKAFTFFNRRHHCRQCGCLVCGDCSSARKMLYTQKIGKRVEIDMMRVCTACHSIN